MSELKVNKVTPRSGTTVTLGDSGDSVAIPTGVGFNGFNHRNIIINGDMSIAQRSTSVASITAGGYYTVDRWRLALDTLGTFTMSQSTDVPTGQGFAKSLKLDCTTADASPSAGDLFQVRQAFEGQNLQYLKKGTASAVSLTASFWVKSTKTGTFICELVDTDNTRQVSASYTVSVSDTWEKKTITFPTDATGAFTNDNNESLRLNFWLGAGTNFTSGTLNTTWGATVNANRAVGQVNIADSTSNDWYITGVQLEAGTTASDFEFLPIDVNLGRCQRYFQNVQTISAVGANTTTIHCNPVFFTTMRSTPSLSVQGVFSINDGTNNFTQSSSSISIIDGNDSGCICSVPNFTSIVANRSHVSRFSNNNKITLSAEL
jgi:hypothetical protein